MLQKVDGHINNNFDVNDLANANPLFTVTEVAAYLKLKPTTVRSMARNGELTAIKVGGMWRFQKSQIDQYLAKLINS